MKKEEIELFIVQGNRFEDWVKNLPVGKNSDFFSKLQYVSGGSSNYFPSTETRDNLLLKKEYKKWSNDVYTYFLISNNGIENEITKNLKRDRYSASLVGFNNFMSILVQYQKLQQNNEKTTESIVPSQIVNNTTYRINDISGKVNIQSVDNSIAINPLDMKVFDEIRSAIIECIENNDIILKALNELEASFGKPTFIEKYKNFIQNVANHMTILSPFIPSLTAMI